MGNPKNLTTKKKGHSCHEGRTLGGAAMVALPKAPGANVGRRGRLAGGHGKRKNCRKHTVAAECWNLAGHPEELHRRSVQGIG
jgi:hypothetical protein